MKHEYIKDKRGTTLVEIMISIGIFSVVMTVSIGFFVVLNGLQDNHKELVNLHQEGRMITEVFSRNIREAQSVTIVSASTGSGETIADSVDICADGSRSAYVYMVTLDGSKKTIFDCPRDNDSVIDENPLYFSMNTFDVSENAWDNNWGFFLTSMDVNIKSFIISNPSPGEETYPRFLKYQMTIEKSYLGHAALPGETLTFRGLITLRNAK